MRPQRGKATCHKRDGLRWASRPAPAPAVHRGRGPLPLTSRPPVRLYTRMPCNKTISSHRGSEIKLHVYFHPQLFFFFFCRRVNSQTLNKQTASLVWTIKQKGRDEPSQDGSMVAAEADGAGGGGRRDAESPRAGHTRRPESVRAKLTLSPQPAPPPSTALKTIETGEKVGRSGAA